MYDLENTFEGKEAEIPADFPSTGDSATPPVAKLDNDLEEDVAGGYIYKFDNHPDYRYEVIDDHSGDVIGRFRTSKEASEAIDAYNKHLGCDKPCQLTTKRIFRYDTVDRIRREYQEGRREHLGKLGPRS